VTPRRPAVFVTGASGFLGGHVVRRFEREDWRIVAPTSHEVDITDRSSTIDAIVRSAPDVIVHTAYRKGDRRATVDGTRHTAEGAVAAGSRLIHTSTDALFAGRPDPYHESDVPDPITDYGRHKAAAEAEVAALAPNATIVRTSLLYGSDHPSPAQLELEVALRSGGSPMTFFSDEIRCPVHADDLADAIATIATRSESPGILHVAGPRPVSRVELATAMAQHVGLSGVSLPVTTIAEAGAVRPARVVLDTSLAASMGITCRSLADALPAIEPR
jgi:dTDP-4-dehydrorhamnose reductase